MSSYSNNVFLLGDFDNSMEQNIIVPFIIEVTRQKTQENPHIDLWINSMGGMAHLAFQWISQIEVAKRSGVVIRTIVTDAAYSAGSAVAVAGTKGERYIEKTARHLIHWGSGGAILTSPEQMERVSASYKSHYDKIYNTYNRYCNIPGLREKMQVDDFTLSSQECIRYGLADKYTESLNLDSSRPTP